MKNKRGITLIALIITIIVMLILVAVTLSISLGDNGILKKARQASEDQLKAQEEEMLQDLILGAIDENTYKVNYVNLAWNAKLAGWTVSEDNKTYTINGDTFEVAANGAITMVEEFDNEEGETEETVGAATFSGYYKEYDEYGCGIGEFFEDEKTLTWEELKLEENGKKYGYHYGGITDNALLDDCEIGTFESCERLKSIVIPNNITDIGRWAFCASGFTSITIPNSVTNIGEGAFCSTNLTSVTIPGSVVSIGESAFTECYDLTTVTIEKGAKTIGRYAFAKCPLLCNVTIPNSITSIEYYAFHNCTSLTHITIPNSVVNIENEIFHYCNALSEVTVGSEQVKTLVENSGYTGTITVDTSVNN